MFHPVSLSTRTQGSACAHNSIGQENEEQSEWSLVLNTPHVWICISCGSHHHLDRAHHQKEQSNAPSGPGTEQTPKATGHRSTGNKQRFEHSIRQWPGEQISQGRRRTRDHLLSGKDTALYLGIDLFLPDRLVGAIDNGDRDMGTERANRRRPERGS